MFPVALPPGLQTLVRGPSWATVSHHLGRQVREQLHESSTKLLKLKEVVKTGREREGFVFSRGNFSCGVENRFKVSTTHKYRHGQAGTA